MLNHGRLAIAAACCHRAYDRALGRRTWKTWPAARSGKRTRMTRPVARAHLAARGGGDGAGGYGCWRGGPALPPVHKELHPLPCLEPSCSSPRADLVWPDRASHCSSPPSVGGDQAWPGLLRTCWESPAVWAPWPSSAGLVARRRLGRLGGATSSIVSLVFISDFSLRSFRVWMELI